MEHQRQPFTQSWTYIGMQVFVALTLVILTVYLWLHSYTDGQAMTTAFLMIGLAIATGLTAIAIILYVRQARLNRELAAINTSLREIAAAIYESKETP